MPGESTVLPVRLLPLLRSTHRSLVRERAAAGAPWPRDDTVLLLDD